MMYDSPAAFDERISNIIFKIKFVLKTGDIIEINAKSDLSINYDNLINDMMASPEKQEAWACLYAEAKYAYDLVDGACKARRGVIINQILEEFGKDNSKIKLTDRIINHMIESDAELLKLEDKKNILNRAVIKLYHTTRAIENRIDILRSLLSMKKVGERVV